VSKSIFFSDALNIRAKLV